MLTFVLETAASLLAKQAYFANIKADIQLNQFVTLNPNINVLTCPLMPS